MLYPCPSNNETIKIMDEFIEMGNLDCCVINRDTCAQSQIRQMESQCANDLFSWVVTEVDITETVPAAPAAAPAQKK